MSIINLRTSYRRVACVDAMKYVTTAVRYSTITAEDLIKYASENSGIPKAQMASAFYALNQQIEQFILNGHALSLGNLGSLYLSTQAKATDDQKDAGADAVVRLSVKFRQSKRLRDLINSSVTLFAMPIDDKSSESGGTTSGDGNDDGNQGDNPLG